MKPGPSAGGPDFLIDQIRANEMRHKKNVRVEYCGGCNPNYDRVEMIERLQSLVEDRFCFALHDRHDFDLLLVVNGCPRACANNNLTRAEFFSKSITEEKDFGDLVEWLAGLEEKGERDGANRNQGRLPSKS